MQAEARLQMARPKDLPLPTVSPEQDLDCLDGMGDGGGEGFSPLPVQEGSRGRSTSKEVRFKTASLPVSWSSSTTREGLMPEEVLGRRTMQPMPVHPGARGDGLEDAMEKHMVHELMEQNRLLKLEVENLREKVVPEEKVPYTTPPRPTTGGVKRTPGGTRVPPPVDTPEQEVVEVTAVATVSEVHNRGF